MGLFDRHSQYQNDRADGLFDCHSHYLAVFESTKGLSHRTKASLAAPTIAMVRHNQMGHFRRQFHSEIGLINCSRQ